MAVHGYEVGAAHDRVEHLLVKWWSLEVMVNRRLYSGLRNQLANQTLAHVNEVPLGR